MKDFPLMAVLYQRISSLEKVWWRWSESYPLSRKSYRMWRKVLGGRLAIRGFASRKASTTNLLICHIIWIVLIFIIFIPFSFHESTVTAMHRFSRALMQVRCSRLISFLLRHDSKIRFNRVWDNKVNNHEKEDGGKSSDLAGATKGRWSVCKMWWLMVRQQRRCVFKNSFQ